MFYVTHKFKTHFDIELDKWQTFSQNINSWHHRACLQLLDLFSFGLTHHRNVDEKYEYCIQCAKFKNKILHTASKVDEMWRKNFLVALSFVSVVCARCHKNFWTPEILWEINVWLNSNLRCLLIRVRLPRNVWNFRKIFFNASTKSQNATENAMVSKRNSFRQQLEYSSLYCHEVEKQPFGKVWVTDAIHFTWDVFARTYVYVSGVCSF